MTYYKKFYIEITNVCNLACSFCPVTKRKPEFMKIETFRLILEQIKPYTKYIYLHVKGEPLLHPKLDQFLDLCHQEGFQVNITSNGTLISKVKDKLLMKPALRQVNFSLHSFDGNIKFIDEFQDELMKELQSSFYHEEVNRDKEQYLNNILNFAKEANDKYGVLISFRLWNLEKDNEINLDDKKNESLLEMIETAFQLPYKIKEQVIPGRGIKIAEGIYVNQDHEFQWPDLKEEEDDGIGFCHGLRNQIAVLVDGTVVPCCLDGEGVINLGNINDTMFSNIISSDRSIAIQEGFSKRQAVEELCRKCGYRKKFSL